MKLFSKDIFGKKEEFISDSGVDLRRNVVDFCVTAVCICVSIGMIILGIMAYTYTF